MRQLLSTTPDSDVVQRVPTLVLGGGVAGMYAAIRASQHGDVLLVTKDSLIDSSSYWAQGGVAAAIGSDDAVSLHGDDTLEVGRGLCDPTTVKYVTDEAPNHVARLQALGVPFETTNGVLDLGLEAGHSRRRIAHAGGGATGRSIISTLTSHVSNSHRITIWQQCEADWLISDGTQCYGAHTARGTVLAGNTILATGGAAALYGRSTNPGGARGEGVAMSYLAGAAIADMEFIQFHPTALTGGTGDGYLLSEALRGEGAHLVNFHGNRFMVDRHPKAELAPRDELSRAIMTEMLDTGHPSVYLDLRHLDADHINKRFGGIARGLKPLGFSLTADRIPVSPAAHYLIGGVWTGLDARTSLPGLTACGEVACTGLHGANRLASNSLLECLVFADAAAQHAASPQSPSGLPPDIEPRTPLDVTNIRQRLWVDAGLVRSESSLKDLAQLLPQVDAGTPSEIINAGLIAHAALLRRESRGAHFRSDFPEESPEWLRHTLQQTGHEPRFLPAGTLHEPIEVGAVNA